MRHKTRNCMRELLLLNQRLKPLNGKPWEGTGRSTMYKPDRDLIKGEKIRVTVETMKYRISGKVFIRWNLRLSDLLNETRNGFLVLTDVQVFSLTDNSILYENDFLAVN